VGTPAGQVTAMVTELAADWNVTCAVAVGPLSTLPTA
jgi:hypothetical protein